MCLILMKIKSISLTIQIYRFFVQIYILAQGKGNGKGAETANRRFFLQHFFREKQTNCLLKIKFTIKSQFFQKKLVAFHLFLYFCSRFRQLDLIGSFATLVDLLSDKGQQLTANNACEAILKHSGNGQGSRHNKKAFIRRFVSTLRNFATFQNLSEHCNCECPLGVFILRPLLLA